jgi:hypothetical protein
MKVYIQGMRDCQIECSSKPNKKAAHHKYIVRLSSIQYRVIPAKAGIQRLLVFTPLDSSLLGHDKNLDKPLTKQKAAHRRLSIITYFALPISTKICSTT